MVATREYVLSRLAAERRQAEQCFAYERVAEIDGQMAALSAGQPGNPAAETTSRSASERADSGSGPRARRAARARG